MGRNKIKIEKIKSERNRNITFIKRKKGLIKKAMELSLLCDAEILVAIVSKDNEQLSLFCSDESVDNFCLKYLEKPIKTNNFVSLKDVKKLFNIIQYSSLFSEIPQKPKLISKKENVLKINKNQINFNHDNINNFTNNYLIDNINKAQNIPFVYNKNHFPFNYNQFNNVYNFEPNNTFFNYSMFNLNNLSNNNDYQNDSNRNEINKSLIFNNASNNSKEKNNVNDSQIVNNINMNIGNINNYLGTGDNSKNLIGIFNQYINNVKKE